MTPYGPIEAKWEITGDGQVAVITVTVPKGTNGTLVLPDGADAECVGHHQRVGRMLLHGGNRTQISVKGWRH